MSERAEAAALKAYPEEMGIFHEADIHYEADLNKAARIKYIEGYEQAEKDLALTIEDLELLHTFLYAVKNNKQGVFTFTKLSDEQYQEVLRRFNSQREKK